MPLKVFKDKLGKYRSDFYPLDGQSAFCIAEKGLDGVLVSEFSDKGEVLDQVYKKSDQTFKEIGEFLSPISKELQIEDVEAIQKVATDATCEACKSKEIVREFDLIDISKVSDVPVAPIFVCQNCKKRYYSMSKPYLRKLVERNPWLFEQKEIKERLKDEEAFITEIQEYMIRIFASKKLAMMKINK